MKNIKKGTITGQSSKAYALVSALLTGAIVFTATGCNAEVKAEGITIDNLEISGSDSDGMPDGANIQVNGSNVSIPEVTIPEPSNNSVGNNSNNNSSDKTLYESFLNNQAGTGYRWDGDSTDDNMTISALLDKLAGEEFTSSVERNNCVSYRYIDCGNDGTLELLLDVSFERLGEDAERYIIIKEISGKLYICYQEDSWYRSLVMISDKGQVDCQGSTSSTGYFYRRGFVDGQGNYKSLFSCETTRIDIDHGTFTYWDPSNNHLDIEWYTDGLEVPFYDWTMAEFHLSDNDSCFTYSIWDSNGNDTTTAEDFKSTARVVDVMNFYGLKVYDHAQIEEMIFSKAEDIGGLGLVSTNIDDIILFK